MFLFDRFNINVDFGRIACLRENVVHKSHNFEISTFRTTIPQCRHRATVGKSVIVCCCCTCYTLCCALIILQNFVKCLQRSAVLFRILYRCASIKKQCTYFSSAFKFKHQFFNHACISLQQSDSYYFNVFQSDSSISVSVSKDNLLICT